jgi:hypothetical protein
MKYVRLILILVLAIASINVSAKKKKKEWPTDSAYIAHRRATIMAMDSVLKLSGLNPDPLMRFADQKCAEFNNDPELMRGFASGFAFSAGYIKESMQRYQKIKLLYPKDFESYSGYAATLFDFSINVNPDGSLTRDPELLNLAKAQIDSAKAAFPDSKAPYLWWLNRCTRYAYNDALVESFQNEVEAYRKAFPKENADYLAATTMGDPKIEMNMTNFDNVYDYDNNAPDKLRSDAEYRRRMLTQEYYDKIDINSLPEDNLYALTYFYYQSTESKYLGRDGRFLLHEKGLERAKLGVEKFPNFTNFSRLQLWHAAELAKTYDYRINQAKRNKDKELQDQETANRNTTAAEGLIGAEHLMSMTDTLLRQDYYFAGVVNQYKGNYSAAIENYQKALGPIKYLEAKLPYKAPYHNCDSITIYENLASCYNAANQSDNAIAQYHALNELKSRHNTRISINDVLNLITQYRAIGNDTSRTQKERFEAYVAVDSLFANIQDSIDAGSEYFPFTEGRVGYYSYQRMAIRSRMNQLSDYKERDNYLVLESAEEVVRRIDPLPEKSSTEKDLISMAAVRLWSTYYNQKDYKSCLPYQKILMKYDPETSDTYKKNFEYARRHAGR